MKTTTSTQPQAEQLALYTRARQPYAGLEIRAQLAQVREATAAKVQTSADIVTLCEDLRQLAQESFNVITVDARNQVIARHLVSLGILDATLIHPREIYRPALLDGAAAIICVHNHPSGDPSPSAEDLKITRQLVEAGRVVDVKLLDHVIVGRPGPASRDGYLSLRESELCAF
jgi:DNA repair protein RadC